MTSVTAVGLAGGGAEYTLRPGLQVIRLPEGYMLKINERHAFVEAEVVPKEQPAWDGEGRPSVGTVCEYVVGGSGGPRHPCTVRYSSEKVIVIHNDRWGDQVVTEAVRLYPIRTAEQIAAEERNKAIFEMAGHSHVGRSEFAMGLCSSLYDAGYRR